MKTHTPSIISEKIFSTYKDKSYYVITACVRELLQCFQELDEYIQNKNTSKAREILHKMLGPTRMINNQELENTIRSIQLAIKESDQYSYPDEEIHKVDSTLHDLLDVISQERPCINVLLFSEDVDDLIKMKNVLLDWDFTNSVTCVQDLKELRLLASESLPDLIIVLDRPYNDEFNESIDTINQRYLGTSLLSWDAKRQLIERPVLTDLMNSIRMSVNAETSNQMFT